MSEECPWCDGAGGDCEECGGTGVASKEEGEEGVDDGWGNMQEQDEDSLPEALQLVRTVSYAFVDDSSISARQNQLIMKCMEQLDVTYDEAGSNFCDFSLRCCALNASSLLVFRCVLRAFLWDLDKACEAWYSSPEETRKRIGVAVPVALPPEGTDRMVQCLTFMCDKVPVTSAKALGCGQHTASALFS